VAQCKSHGQRAPSTKLQKAKDEEVAVHLNRIMMRKTRGPLVLEPGDHAQ
jgi:hypothetical protein